MATKIIEYAKNKKICGGGNSEVSGTINIEANGIYGVAKYATANVNVPDTSGMAIEVSELPTPTAGDVGKVYLNTTNGEHYLGEEQVQEFVVGESLGNKIYFDTSVDLSKYELLGVGEQKIILNSENKYGNSFQILYIAADSEGVGKMWMLMLLDVYSPVPVYVYCDTMSVEEYNANLGSQIGYTITNFGWQTDVYEHGNPDEFIVTENQLSEYGNLAYKSKTIAFKPLDEPPVLQEKTVTENGVVTADAGYDGLSKVTVDVADKGTATLNALIDGSITEIESEVESVSSGIFMNDTSLQSASFPNVTNIGTYGFYNCTELQTVNIPKVTSIGNYAFEYCRALTSIDIPNVTSIGGSAFESCSSLVSMSCPNVTSLGNATFKNCTKLASIDFPNVTSIDGSAFSACYPLKSVDFPNVTTIKYQSFYSCSELARAYFPNITKIESSNTFAKCFSLVCIVIGTNQTTIATLANTNAFESCCHIFGQYSNVYNPTGAKDGYIYVPHSLVADYRVATNWATYATQIMPYVATLKELTNIDGTTYDKACVGTDYIEYTYNGTTWEVYTR